MVLSLYERESFTNTTFTSIKKIKHVPITKYSTAVTKKTTTKNFAHLKEICHKGIENEKYRFRQYLIINSYLEFGNNKNDVNEK